MKQSYAPTGKAPKRRVHSPIGIVAIAVCGLRHLGSSLALAYQHSQAPNPVCPFLFYSVAHAAGRNSTPSGISPVVTNTKPHVGRLVWDSRIACGVIQHGKRRIVCHGDSHCGAVGLYEPRASWVGSTGEGRRAGAATVGDRGGA